MNNEELQACPFCGGPAVNVACEYVTCGLAEPMGERCIGKSIRAPVDDDNCAISTAWNTRALVAGADPADDWQDDPSADERWNAGLEFAMMQLCGVLAIDPKTVMWDAATETLDGDVSSIIGNILRARFGDDADLRATPAAPQAAMPSREEIARAIWEKRPDVGHKPWPDAKEQRRLKHDPMAAFDLCFIYADAILSLLSRVSEQEGAGA